MTLLTKNPYPQPKIFSECRLEDLLSLLSLSTVLYRFCRQSYACTKPRAIHFFGAKFSNITRCKGVPAYHGASF